MLNISVWKRWLSFLKADGADGTNVVTSGDWITDQAQGKNLVDGLQTSELPDEKKHDIDVMKRCCEAELMTMKRVGLVPAPYYFERVAILSRKIKDYEQEVSYCETYIETVESFYRRNDPDIIADVRKGPRFKAIKKRLPKAKKLLASRSE